MRIAVAADEDIGVARTVLDELRARGHEPLPHGALAAGGACGLGVGGRGGGQGCCRRPRGRGGGVLLDGDRRQYRCEQGAGRPGRVVRRRADRGRRPPVERRERARAVVADHLRGGADGDPRRLVRRRALGRRQRIGPTSRIWTRSGPDDGVQRWGEAVRSLPGCLRRSLCLGRSSATRPGRESATGLRPLGHGVRFCTTAGTVLA